MTPSDATPALAPALDAAAPRRARRVALAWAAATLVGLAATAPSQGIGHEEAAHLAAAERHAGFWGEALRAPGQALRAADARFGQEHDDPPLVETLAGVTHAALRGALGHLEALRAAAFLVAAALSYLLATAGFALAGAWGALLAPALFWAAPRHVDAARAVALDLPLAACWLAAAMAYRRALRTGASPAATVVAGLAFGAALATEHGAWYLGATLALHALVTRLPALRRASDRGQARRVLLALAILGPALLVVLWPWLWHDPPARLRAYAAVHAHRELHPWLYLGRLLHRPPYPASYPLVVTALTVPAAVAAALAGGAVHAAARLVAAIRAGAARAGAPGAPDAADELLLLLGVAVPLAIGAWSSAPHEGGVARWLPAMPFLALLGARALVAAGRTLAPARAGAATAALACAALLPAACAVAHAGGRGTAAWGELAGGAPGAASLRMERQARGRGAEGVLAEVNDHAAPGARVWWPDTAPAAVVAWQRDGRLRADLQPAGGPRDADVAVWAFDPALRDREFEIWTAFAQAPRPHEPARHPRPVAGDYLDEVPLAAVYARPGAWR